MKILNMVRASMGGSTDIGHVAVQSFQDRAKSLNVALAVLFIDCRSAYASVVRSWTSPQVTSDFVWVQRLQKMSFTKVEIAEILAEAANFSSWYEEGGSEHLLKLINASHQCSWASVEEVRAIFVYFSGVIAGSSKADVLFSICADHS